MTKGNYRIQLTLKDATLDDLSIMVDYLGQDFELSIDEFDVETLIQNDDGTWESTGVLFDPDA